MCVLLCELADQKKLGGHVGGSCGGHSAPLADCPGGVSEIGLGGCMIEPWWTHVVVRALNHIRGSSLRVTRRSGTARGAREKSPGLFSPDNRSASRLDNPNSLVEVGGLLRDEW